ncbi:MAG TPA: hypothetical protein PKA30_15550, partial [Accumulibacter sp.]|nr:hypothetical protein [Accumulibacter sp.]
MQVFLGQSSSVQATEQGERRSEQGLCGRVAGRQLLPESWIAQLTTPSPLNPSVGTYWWVEPTPLIPSNVDR